MVLKCEIITLLIVVVMCRVYWHTKQASVFPSRDVLLLVGPWASDGSRWSHTNAALCPEFAPECPTFWFGDEHHGILGHVACHFCPIRIQRLQYVQSECSV